MPASNGADFLKPTCPESRLYPRERSSGIRQSPTTWRGPSCREMPSRMGESMGELKTSAGREHRFRVDIMLGSEEQCAVLHVVTALVKQGFDLRAALPNLQAMRNRQVVQCHIEEIVASLDRYLARGADPGTADTSTASSTIICRPFIENPAMNAQDLESWSGKSSSALHASSDRYLSWAMVGLAGLASLISILLLLLLPTLSRAFRD